MAAGIQITRDEINNQAGAIARAVFNGFQNVNQFKAWLDGVSGSDLESLYDYSSGDAAVLKSAFADLGDLAAVFAGNASAYTLPHDYRAFSRQLLGTGLY